MKHDRIWRTVAFLLLASSFAPGQERRKVIIDQDCSGPGGSNLEALLVMLQAPQVEVLGITVVSGDQWRDEEVAHALRLLEIIGRTEIPVVPGAVFPRRPRKPGCGSNSTEKWPMPGRGTTAGGMSLSLFLGCRRDNLPPSRPSKTRHTSSSEWCSNTRMR